MFHLIPCKSARAKNKKWSCRLVWRKQNLHYDWSQWLYIALQGKVIIRQCLHALARTVCYVFQIALFITWISYNIYEPFECTSLPFFLWRKHKHNTFAIPTAECHDMRYFHISFLWNFFLMLSLMFFSYVLCLQLLYEVCNLWVEKSNKVKWVALQLFTGLREMFIVICWTSIHLWILALLVLIN